MIVLSHPTANAFNRQLAGALQRAGKLSVFHTTVTFGRRGVALPAELVRTHPWPEIGRLAAQKLGLRKLATSERSPFGIDRIYRALDAAVARTLNSAADVYAYEDGALLTFRAAREKGLRRFYELPIAFWETSQRLLREEAERLPEWAGTLGAPDDSPEKLVRKTEELALSDVVICPSQFVADSLPPGTRCVVAEFGSPSISAAAGPPINEGPLRVLFAGAMSQRKGLADLFAAFRLLQRRDIELVVMGAAVAAREFYRRAYPNFTYEPPRPHVKFLELMSSCHVLALPSIVEGRALVQQEALSRGLPLLVTANAGGADLIEPGLTGWLAPIRDPAALADRLNWFADHRAQLPDWRAAARRKAAECSWDAYGKKILAAIDPDPSAGRT
jgi:glycosyltransferase involved in cell wall biosynthesis